MNIYTREIAKILEISLDDALRIQDEMECNGFDFSEAQLLISLCVKSSINVQLCLSNLI